MTIEELILYIQANKPPIQENKPECKSLEPSTLEYLHTINDPEQIDGLYRLFQGYKERGIAFYPLLDSIFTTRMKRLMLPPDFDGHILRFLNERPIDYSAIISRLYQNKWLYVITQTRDFRLSYHQMYHFMEVCKRALELAALLGLFEGKNQFEQFLYFLLLIAGKYHDYIQRCPDELNKNPDTAKYNTVEEQTAVLVAEWIIKELQLSEEEPLAEWIHLFFRETIGLGTPLIFGKNEQLILSTLSSEIEDILGSSYRGSNQALLEKLKIMREILTIVDTMSPTCINIVKNQPSIAKNVQRYLGRERLYLFDFFKTLPPYCPTESQETNFEIFCMFLTAHMEMQVELNRMSENADVLRELIKQGQTFYRESSEEKLGKHLDSLLNETYREKFFQLYVANLDKEQRFIERLKPVCERSISVLKGLGCINERGQSRYLLTAIPGGQHSIPPLIDPSVLSREFDILGETPKYLQSCDEEVKSKTIQEMLAVCMLQTGIDYVKKPVSISMLEPASIDCRTPPPSSATQRFSSGKYPRRFLSSDEQKNSKEPDILALPGFGST